MAGLMVGKWVENSVGRKAERSVERWVACSVDLLAVMRAARKVAEWD
jgi:hypothetical protein